MMKLEDLQDSILYPATLRGKDKQLLSTGTARFYASQSKGEFLPQDTSILRILQASKVIVEIHQGPSMEVHNLRPCKSQPHFHFDL
jgi:hypothetical protein